MSRIFIGLSLVFACACVACSEGKEEDSFGIKGASGTDGVSFAGTNNTIAGSGGSTDYGADSGQNTLPVLPTIPSEVQDYISELVDNSITPGVVVALITGDGVTYHSYGKVAVDGDPVNEYTIFEIGSTAKVFTATLLSDMVEQGKVALDDSVQRYLPPDATMPGGESITLEHLATHRSGLPRDAFVLTEYNGYAGYTAEQLYDFLSNYTLTREPGTEFEYSNVGMGLLGYVLSLATGMSYEELVVDRISKPLVMEDTMITLSEEQQLRFATGYGSDGKVAENLDFGILAGCGALRSTAADMARYIQANLGLYETVLYAALQRSHETRAETTRENQHIGLGWIIDTFPSAEIVWHSGGTGAYRSYFGFNQSQKVGVVVLTNSSYDIDPIGEHILVSEVELPPIRKAVPVAIEVLESYVGTYQLGPTVTIEVALEGETLMVGITGLPTLPPIKIPAFPESEVNFFSRELDGEITFEKDDTGRVVALVLTLGGIEQRAEKIM